MGKIYQPIKLQKKQTHLNLFRTSENLWKDLFAYPFFALTRQHLKTENNKLNIYWYTQYLMKSTFETIWLFFHRPVILYACVQFYTHRASDYRLSWKTGYLFVNMYTCTFKLYNYLDNYLWSTHCLMCDLDFCFTSSLEHSSGADPGALPPHPPLKLEKIVIFHTKYTNNFRASLRWAQFF